MSEYSKQGLIDAANEVINDQKDIKLIKIEEKLDKLTEMVDIKTKRHIELKIADHLIEEKINKTNKRIDELFTSRKEANNRELQLIEWKKMIMDEITKIYESIVLIEPNLDTSNKIN